MCGMDLSNITRLNNHHHNITKGFLKHILSRHAFTHHECNIEEFSVMAIEQISENVTNKLDVLAKREICKIFRLNTIIPYGLNENVENVF